MAIHRYSATEVFGVPIDNPEHIAEGGIPAVVRLMESSNLEPQLVQPTEITDITPYYWLPPKAKFRYLMEAQQVGEVSLHMLPALNDSMAYGISRVGPLTVAKPELQRSFRLPLDQDAFLISGGGSPRYTGKICVFEAFVNL